METPRGAGRPPPALKSLSGHVTPPPVPAQAQAEVHRSTSENLGRSAEKTSYVQSSDAGYRRGTMFVCEDESVAVTSLLARSDRLLVFDKTQDGAFRVDQCAQDEFGPTTLRSRVVRREPFFGLLGLVDLGFVRLAVTATGRRLVGHIAGRPVWNVTKGQVRPTYSQFYTTLEQDEQLQVAERAIRQLLNEQRLYYAHGYNMTCSLQRNWDRTGNVMAPMAPFQGIDEAFLYNHAWLSPFLGDGRGEYEEFLLPVVSGFVETRHIRPALRDTTLLAGSSSAETFDDGRETAPGLFTITVVSRCSRHRSGASTYARGVDVAGASALHVETETIVYQPPSYLMSWVQLRGSVPLLWQEKLTSVALDFFVDTSLVNSPLSLRALGRHLDRLVAQYGAPVVCVDVLGAGARVQEPLSESYARHVWAYAVASAAQPPDGPTRYCRLQFGDWAALRELMNQTFARQGFFFVSEAAPAAPLCRQQGVFRTNDLDSVDETNAVQFWLARGMIMYMFEEASASRFLGGVSPGVVTGDSGSSLPSPVQSLSVSTGGFSARRDSDLTAEKGSWWRPWRRRGSPSGTAQSPLSPISNPLISAQGSPLTAEAITMVRLDRNSLQTIGGLFADNGDAISRQYVNTNAYYGHMIRQSRFAYLLYPVSHVLIGVSRMYTRLLVDVQRHDVIHTFLGPNAVAVGRSTTRTQELQSQLAHIRRHVQLRRYSQPWYVALMFLCRRYLTPAQVHTPFQFAGALVWLLVFALYRWLFALSPVLLVGIPRERYLRMPTVRRNSFRHFDQDMQAVVDASTMPGRRLLEPASLLPGPLLGAPLAQLDAQCIDADNPESDSDSSASIDADRLPARAVAETADPPNSGARPYGLFTELASVVRLRPDAAKAANNGLVLTNAPTAPSSPPLRPLRFQDPSAILVARKLAQQRANPDSSTSASVDQSPSTFVSAFSPLLWRPLSVFSGSSSSGPQSGTTRRPPLRPSPS